MDLSPELVVAGYVALGGAIAWLARNQVVSQRRCERESTECRAKQAALDGFIRTTLMGMVEESATRESAATNELARARRVLEIHEKRHAITHDDSTPIVPARAHG